MPKPTFMYSHDARSDMSAFYSLKNIWPRDFILQRHHVFFMHGNSKNVQTQFTKCNL